MQCTSPNPRLVSISEPSGCRNRRGQLFCERVCTFVKTSLYLLVPTVSEKHGAVTTVSSLANRFTIRMMVKYLSTRYLSPKLQAQTSYAPRSYRRQHTDLLKEPVPSRPKRRVAKQTNQVRLDRLHSNFGRFRKRGRDSKATARYAPYSRQPEPVGYHG